MRSREGERLRRLGLRAAAATVSSHQLGGIVDAGESVIQL